MSYVNLTGKDWLVVQTGTINVLKAYKVHKTAKKKADELNADVMSKDFYFDKCNEEVTVKNIMSGKDVTITRRELGGPCDPSTERFHSM